MPKEIDKIKNLSMVEQIVNQVYFLRQNIVSDFKEIGNCSCLTLNYEDLCGNPQKSLLMIEEFLKKSGLIFKKKTIYYMFGGSNPKFRNSQSLSLLMWNAIQLGISQNKSFDFEGSMIQPIENFFRSFGANQVPYFELIKLNHWTSKLKNIFNQIIY